MTTVKTYLQDWATSRLARPDEVPPQLQNMQRTLAKIAKRTKSRKESAGDELDRRARAHIRAHGGSYFDALSKVSKSAPAVAAEYAAVDRDAHRADTHDGKYGGRQETLDSSSGLPRENVPDQATAQITRGEAGSTINDMVLALMRNPDYRGITYEQAFTAVLQMNPDLADAYRGTGPSDINYDNWSWQA